MFIKIINAGFINPTPIKKFKEIHVDESLIKKSLGEAFRIA